MTRNSSFGEPKIAVATAFSMSMSKPSIVPVMGFREPSSKVSADTPAINRPCALIRAIVEPAGSAFGLGSGPVGAYDASGLPQVWPVAGGAAEAAGGGVLFTGSGVASYALGPQAQVRKSTARSAAAGLERFIGTPPVAGTGP